jgi:hypothetical protein
MHTMRERTRASLADESRRRRTRLGWSLPAPSHLALVWSLLLLWSPAPALAQRASEPALRAAFIYNFAKFTIWPADAIAPEGSLVFCVLGDFGVAEMLEQVVKGHDLRGHALMVRRVEAADSFRSCHVLYASGLDAKRAAELLRSVEATTVLTVSDFEEFTRLGGMATIFVEDERMRFAFNTSSVQRGRLAVSSKLLTLARIVRSRDAAAQ